MKKLPYTIGRVILEINDVSFPFYCFVLVFLAILQFTNIVPTFQSWARFRFENILFFVGVSAVFKAAFRWNSITAAVYRLEQELEKQQEVFSVTEQVLLKKEATPLVWVPTPKRTRAVPETFSVRHRRMIQNFLHGVLLVLAPLRYVLTLLPNRISWIAAKMCIVAVRIMRKVLSVTLLAVTLFITGIEICVGNVSQGMRVLQRYVMRLVVVLVRMLYCGMWKTTRLIAWGVDWIQRRWIRGRTPVVLLPVLVSHLFGLGFLSYLGMLLSAERSMFFAHFFSLSLREGISTTLLLLGVLWLIVVRNENQGVQSSVGLYTDAVLEPMFEVNVKRGLYPLLAWWYTKISIQGHALFLGTVIGTGGGILLYYMLAPFTMRWVQLSVTATGATILFAISFMWETTTLLND